MRLGGRLSAAIEILSDIDTRHRPVADALKDWGLSHRFAGSGDRAAIGNLVYDVLRAKRSLAFRMGGDTSAALVIGAALDGLRLTPETLTQALDGDRFAPDLPDAERLAAFALHDLEGAERAVRADVPDWLGEKFEASFGDTWVEEAAALSDRPPLDLRVNTLKASREKVEAALSPFVAQPTAIAPTGLRVAPIEGAGRHPNVQIEAGFQKGWFEIQDEGSQIVTQLSGAQPGEQVLDFCAGAGGKSLALASMMANTGQVHAFDSDRQRLAPIHERLKRAEVRNVQVHDPRDDLSDLQNRMDLVLIDAPCTGTGTWRRRPDAKWRLAERQLDKRTAEQDAVLDQAAKYVRPGGRLVYVTCSLLPDENEARIAAFLERTDGFAIADAQTAWQRAFPESTAASRPFLLRSVGGGSALVLTPRTSGTDGFFFCELVRG